MFPKKIIFEINSNVKNNRATKLLKNDVYTS